MIGLSLASYWIDESFLNQSQSVATKQSRSTFDTQSKIAPSQAPGGMLDFTLSLTSRSLLLFNLFFLIFGYFD